MIIRFSPVGLSRFSLSLSRFFGMRRSEALDCTNLCALANYDAVRATQFIAHIEPVAFALWDSGIPYLTEVQMYKSMQTLLSNILLRTPDKQEAACLIRAKMSELTERIWNSYNLDIEDKRTVYALCEETLAPQAEPACVLLEDWCRYCKAEV